MGAEPLLWCTRTDKSQEKDKNWFCLFTLFLCYPNPNPGTPNPDKTLCLVLIMCHITLGNIGMTFRKYPKLYCIEIVMVLFCSAILGDYTLFCKSTHRFTLAPELHPDWMLMLFFAHTHLTVTVTLGLLLVPKVNPQISFHSLIICWLKSNFTESLKYPCLFHSSYLRVHN